MDIWILAIGHVVRNTDGYLDTWSCREKYRWILGHIVRNTDGYLVIS